MAKERLDQTQVLYETATDFGRQLNAATARALPSWLGSGRWAFGVDMKDGVQVSAIGNQLYIYLPPFTRVRAVLIQLRERS